MTATRLTAVLSLALLLAIAVACVNLRRSKQYQCTLPGQSEPATAYQYVERGFVHIRLDQYECAFGACSEAIRLDPKLALGYSCRGVLWLQQDNFSRALKDFNQALQLEPDNGDLYKSRAQLYRRLDEDARALADLNKAIVLIASEFGKSTAYSARAEIHDKEGKLDEAMKDYDQAIRLAPSFAYYHEARGNLFSKKGDFEHAIADYTEAIRLDPKNQYFYMDREQAYCQMRK